MIVWTEMRAKGLKMLQACVAWTDEEEVMMLKAWLRIPIFGPNFWYPN
jgi:hypothetical protein